MFRDADMATYLIAKQQEVSDTHTIVNLQGALDQEYVVSIQFSPKPRRAKFSEGWPETPEENLSRLAKAGWPMDRMVPKCTNCDRKCCSPTDSYLTIANQRQSSATARVHAQRRSVSASSRSSSARTATVKATALVTAQRLARAASVDARTVGRMATSQRSARSHVTRTPSSAGTAARVSRR